MTDRPILAARMSEKQLLQALSDLCRVLRIDFYHTHRSEHSPAGFPDCVMIRKADRIGLPSTLMVAELKSAHGRVSPDQERWLRSFEAAGVPAYVWRPSHWLSGEIERALRGDEP